MFYEKNVSMFAGRCWYLVALSGTVWSWSWSWSWNWQDWAVQTLKKRKASSIYLWDTTYLILKIILLIKNTVFCKSSPTLHKKNDNILHYVRYTNPGESGVLSFWPPYFTRCSNKKINSRIKRSTPGHYMRKEPGFDVTPMFTTIQISF